MSVVNPSKWALLQFLYHCLKSPPLTHSSFHILFFSLRSNFLLWAILSLSIQGFQVVPVVKNTSANAGDVRDTGSVPGLGRSPGGGHGNPSGIPAWEILRTEGPGRLHSCTKSDTTEMNLARMHTYSIR